MFRPQLTEFDMRVLEVFRGQPAPVVVQQLGLPMTADSVAKVVRSMVRLEQATLEMVEKGFM